MRRVRLENVDVLYKGLMGKVRFLFPEEDIDCPLFVPLLLESKKRDALRNYLRDKNIYCPIHWSIEPEHRLTSLTADLYKREISIVCDQRYDENDMFLILNRIKESDLI